MPNLEALKNWLVRLYIHYFVRTDPRDKCPACGIRQMHQIKFDPESDKLLHRCSTLHAQPEKSLGCGAIWTTGCLIDPKQWNYKVVVPQETGVSKVEQPDNKFVEISREPVKTIKPIDKAKISG